MKLLCEGCDAETIIGSSPQTVQVEWKQDLPYPMDSSIMEYYANGWLRDWEEGIDFCPSCSMKMVAKII